MNRNARWNSEIYDKISLRKIFNTSNIDKEVNKELPEDDLI